MEEEFRISELRPVATRSRRVFLIALVAGVSQLAAQTGRARLLVTDTNHAFIVGAEVSLVTNGNPIRREKTNTDGEALLDTLPGGESNFQIVSPGFETKLLSVTIRNAAESKLEVMLEVRAYVHLVVTEGPDDYGSLQVHIADVLKMPISVSQVSILDSSGKPQRTSQPDAAGLIIFALVAAGDCRLLVTAPGFGNLTLRVVVSSRKEERVEAILEALPPR